MAGSKSGGSKVGANVPTILFAGNVLEITNPRNIQPVSADIYTEIRNYNGIACLSFACIIAEGTAKPRAETVARIRLTLAGASDLRNALDGLLAGAMPGKKGAN